MTLADELNAFKAQFLSQIDEESHAVMEQAAADLEQDFRSRQLLSEGDIAPDFTLPTATGTPLTLSDKLKEGPVIISFYRGNWCPYCNLELRAYQQILPEIKAAGGSLIAISPQTPDSSLSNVEKNELKYDVLSDVGSQVSQNYGVAFKMPDPLIALYKQLGGNLPDFNGTDDWTLPVPATFVIDRDSRIVLANIDPEYQNRLEPAEALAAIKAINAEQAV